MPTSMRRTAGLLAAAGVCLLGAMRTSDAQVLPRRAPRDTVPRTPTVRWQFDQCMGGVTYGAPYKWALSYGMGLVRESPTSDWCLLGAAKVGLGGASMNIGLANSIGHWGSGAALTAGFLRTFDDPLKATAKRNYVGASLHVWPVLALGGEIGYYTRLGNDPVGLGTKRGMVTWSAGFGFCTDAEHGGRPHAPAFAVSADCPLKFLPSVRRIEPSRAALPPPLPWRPCLPAPPSARRASRYRSASWPASPSACGFRARPPRRPP
jgi:hypothetical protein